MKSRTAQIAWLLLGILTVVQPGYAQSSREAPREEARESSEQASTRGEEAVTISRRKASELAREAYDGRVLSVRLDRGQWRIRMDEDGTVFNVLVNAESGKVSRAAE